MILMSGCIAVAYGTKSANAILAMNLGASAPAIIGALATPPKTDGADARGFDGPENVPARRRLRQFLAFGA